MLGLRHEITVINWPKDRPDPWRKIVPMLVRLEIMAGQLWRSRPYTVAEMHRRHSCSIDMEIANTEN